MLDLNLIRDKVEKLDEYYNNGTAPTKEELNNLKKYLPKDYILFIETFGFGEVLEDILNLWYEPESVRIIYKNEKNFNNLIVFGDNLSGDIFCIHNISKKIVILDATGKIREEFNDFNDFIIKYLNYIINLLDL